MPVTWPRSGAACARAILRCCRSRRTRPCAAWRKRATCSRGAQLEAGAPAIRMGRARRPGSRRMKMAALARPPRRVPPKKVESDRCAAATKHGENQADDGEHQQDVNPGAHVEPDTRPRTHSTSRITVMVQSMPYLLCRKGRSRTVVKRAYRRGVAGQAPGRSATAHSCFLAAHRAGVARSLVVLRRSLRTSMVEGALAELVGACTSGGVLTAWALYLELPRAHRRARRFALSHSSSPACSWFHPPLRRPAGRLWTIGSRGSPCCRSPA